MEILDSVMWSGHKYLNFGNFPKEAEHGSEPSLGVVVFQVGFLDQHQYQHQHHLVYLLEMKIWGPYPRPKKKKETLMSF